MSEHNVENKRVRNYLEAVVDFALGLQRLQLDGGGADQRVAPEKAAETAKPVASEAAGSTHKNTGLMECYAYAWKVPTATRTTHNMSNYYYIREPESPTYWPNFILNTT